MSENEAPTWIFYVFPFAFVAFWVFVSSVLGAMSGWYSLQAWYADEKREPPLLSLYAQSGSMGMGVSMGNCLTLRTYPSELGIAIWRIFGPFQRPLLVPWREIEAKSSTTFFMPMMTLELGGRSVDGRLKIRRKIWEKLIAALPADTRGELHIDRL